jgi:hypothetical protein
VLVSGDLDGSRLAAHWDAPQDVAISPATKLLLTQLGIHDLSGLARHEISSWHALLTVREFVS